MRLALRMRMYLRVKANATVGYDVNYTYVVGDDSKRHRWQCTTSLVPQLQLSRYFPLFEGHVVTVRDNLVIYLFSFFHTFSET